MRYHYTTIKLAKIRIETTANAGEDGEKQDHLYSAAENIIWHCQSGKLFGNFLKY